MDGQLTERGLRLRALKFYFAAGSRLLGGCHWNQCMLLSFFFFGVQLPEL